MPEISERELATLRAIAGALAIHGDCVRNDVCGNFDDAKGWAEQWLEEEEQREKSVFGVCVG